MPPRTPVTRRDLLMAAMAAAGGLALACDRHPERTPNPHEEAMSEPTAEPKSRMPVLFVGHGSPMNAIEDTRWSRGFRDLGSAIPRPRAILAISAHWFVDGVYVTGDVKPRTIHDFSGFPPALHEIQYPAPGEPELAQRVQRLIGDERAALRNDWGLDHGTWSVLHWMYPSADIPVIQLSLDRRLSFADHHRLGRTLAPLRDEGILILASGNIVHNLRDAFTRMQRGNSETPDWARRFDDDVKRAVSQHDADALIRLGATEDGRLAHPSPDHWLPLLYAQAAAHEQDQVQFPTEGFDLGSLSMRNIHFG